MDMRFKSGMFLVFAAAVIIGILAGRSQSPASSATASTVPVLPTAVPRPALDHVSIVSTTNSEMPGRFNPMVLTVHVGQKVTWVNTANANFNATADNGAFTTGVLSPGQTYNWKAKKAGTYTYGDYLHPSLTGTIVVQP